MPFLGTKAKIALGSTLGMVVVGSVVLIVLMLVLKKKNENSQPIVTVRPLPSP